MHCPDVCPDVHALCFHLLAQRAVVVSRDAATRSTSAPDQVAAPQAHSRLQVALDVRDQLGAGAGFEAAGGAGRAVVAGVGWPSHAGYAVGVSAGRSLLTFVAHQNRLMWNVLKLKTE